MGANVRLAADECVGDEDGDCLLRQSLARLPRGGVLELEGGDLFALEQLRSRCGQLGYHILGDGPRQGKRSLTVVKAGGRNGKAPAPVWTSSPGGGLDSVGYSWSVRGHSADGRTTRVHVGRHTFAAGPAVSFRPDEPLPSAIEHLLAALAADVVSSFASCLREREVDFDAIECRLSGHLEDPLASIGVIGTAGSPALSAIGGAVYVNAEAEVPLLHGAWCAAIGRSPLFNTLAPCVELGVEMRVER